LNYYPEWDKTPELNPDQATFYQTQIGVLRWCVELGRIDIITEVSELNSYLAMPREGHLEAVFPCSTSWRNDTTHASCSIQRIRPLIWQLLRNVTGAPFTAMSKKPFLLMHLPREGKMCIFDCLLIWTMVPAIGARNVLAPVSLSI
jgi:hypothetical protein